MKKINMIFSVSGALMGFGGAYATSHSHSQSGRVNVPYNWYLSDGQLAFTATIAVARSICSNGSVVICLRGTASAFQQLPVTLFRP